jgi:hypothetical protein
MFEDHSVRTGAAEASVREAIERAIDKENLLRKKRRRKDGPLCNTNIRLLSIRSLILGRYGGPCPPHVAEIFLDATLPLLKWKANRIKRHDHATCPMTWAQGWAPSLLEHGERWFEEKKRAVGSPRWALDDEIGELLAVEAWEIKAYRLRRIGAVDKTSAERKAEAKEVKRRKDRERMRKKRAAHVGNPRSQPLFATQPWKKLGICRRTWERRRAAGKL